MRLKPSDMDYELHEVKTNKSNGSAYLSHDVERAVNGDSATPDPTETDRLFPEQTTATAEEIQIHVENANTPQKTNFIGRIMRELNTLVYWRVRLWMVIIFILILIFAVIIISLLVCSVIHEDPDENFDLSLFNVPLYFNGSFELPNLVFTEELFNLSSIESQKLATDFKEKLGDLYRSSPALGRYFSEAEIYAFRNGSVIADFQLTFLMPEAEQDQLKNFTLSREMVFNVFRQYLYDQELNESEPVYINPVSLNMFLGQ